MATRGSDEGKAWLPAAVLPNISVEKEISCDRVALVHPYDSRILEGQPGFRQFLGRFTDAFGKQLSPASIIAREDLIPITTEINCVTSFRDALMIALVPYSRAQRSRGSSRHEICYSDYLAIHPCMLNKNGDAVNVNTPGMWGGNSIESFHGQCSPAVPVGNLDEWDNLLLDALVPRWREYYCDKNDVWENRALFRSLNMAQQAAGLPAGRDVTMYDVGRMFVLWVSAFEILAHPGPNSGVGYTQVYDLLKRVPYINSALVTEQWQVFSKKGRVNNTLPCKLYGDIYQLRNDFLHGNEIDMTRFNPEGDKPSLFWIAPLIYRLALTAFLNMARPDVDREDFSEFERRQGQSVIESVVLQLS